MGFYADWIRNTSFPATFPGLKDRRQRADLLAFLKEATRPGQAPSTSAQRGGQMGGMMGMMGGGSVPNLKKLDADERMQAISHCRDTYHAARLCASAAFRPVSRASGQYVFAAIFSVLRN